MSSGRIHPDTRKKDSKADARKTEPTAFSAEMVMPADGPVQYTLLNPKKPLPRFCAEESGRLHQQLQARFRVPIVFPDHFL